MEVIVTSDELAVQWTVCIWDAQNGTVLRTFKGGVSSSRTLGFIGCDYMISAEKGKNLLHVWPLTKKNEMQQKVACQGHITALAVSPNGSYLVASMGKEIYVWLMPQNKLYANFTYHYQTVRVIRFNDDGTHFVTGGDDGRVFCWRLTPLLIPELGPPKPRYSWHDHRLPVTDVHIDRGVFPTRVVTVSLDCSCNIYDMRSGNRLVNIAYKTPLLSVTMDHAGINVFVGDGEGIIRRFHLLNTARVVREMAESDNGIKNKYVGHTNAVTCLSVSSDGSRLLSGSDDSTVRVWDVKSSQCLRVLQHKAPITNATFASAGLEKPVPGIAMPERLKLGRSDDGEKHPLLVRTVDKECKEPMQIEHAVTSNSASCPETSDLCQINRELFRESLQGYLNNCTANFNMVRHS